MRTDVMELLRCPVAHDASPLVTVARRRDGAWLIDATLGCPVCGAEYALRDGVALLGGDRDGDAPPPNRPVDAMRIAALLGLADPGLRVMLCGSLGAAAVGLESATGARCVVVNGATAADDARVDQLVIAARGLIPLASASLDGLAVDAHSISLLSDGPRVVRQGGRIIAPVNTPVPDRCRELARDQYEWVAEVQSAATAPVSIQLSASRKR